MTSPGSWFGGFLNDTLGGSTSKSSGSASSSSSKAPRAPSVNTAPGYQSSADSYERHTSQGTYAEPQQASKYGAVLYSALDLPDDWAGQVVTMGKNSRPVTDGLGNPAQQTQLIQMTVAAGLEWLRNMAVTNKEQYNSWVVKLYDAGYLTEKDLRFNAYTSTVAQAFVEAAHDTASVNLSDSAGRLVTLGDNLDNIAQGFKDAGMDSGSAGNAPAPRVDQKLDDVTLKSSLHDTARSLLGRKLSDSEEAALVGRFRTVESAWNDNNYSARLNGGTVTNTPDPNAIGEAGINDTLGTERTAQQLGGYAGVLMNMVGLGHSTSIGGTLGGGQ